MVSSSRIPFSRACTTALRSMPRRASSSSTTSCSSASAPSAPWPKMPSASSLVAAVRAARSHAAGDPLATTTSAGGGGASHGCLSTSFAVRRSARSTHSMPWSSSYTPSGNASFISSRPSRHSASLVNGYIPVSNTCAITPSAHTSTALPLYSGSGGAPAPRPAAAGRSSSGAAYTGTIGVRRESNFSAGPTEARSITLTQHLGPARSITLFRRRSRWHTPAECMYATALVSCCMISCASAGPHPCVCINSPSVMPGTHSSTRTMRCESKTSCRRTICSCSSCAYSGVL